MTPLEIVQQTSPIINQAGNRFYFDADTMARARNSASTAFVSTSSDAAACSATSTPR